MAILNWLSGVDPSLNYNEARKRHTPTTSGWFMKGQSCAKWIHGEVPNAALHDIHTYRSHKV
jgi:hypothetical protein